MRGASARDVLWNSPFWSWGLPGSLGHGLGQPWLQHLGVGLPGSLPMWLRPGGMDGGSAPSFSRAAGEPRARIKLEVFVAGILTWQHARLSRASDDTAASRSRAGSTLIGATSMVGTKEEGARSLQSLRCCCSGRMCSGSSGCRAFLAFEISVIASSPSLHNHGVGSYPFPARGSRRNIPHHARAACCRHHPPAELYQTFRNSISRLVFLPAPSCAWEGLRQLLALREE